MAKTIALLTLVMMNVAAVAQSSYTVIYSYVINVDSTGKSRAQELKSALYVISDTMTVFKMADNEKQLMKKLDLSSRGAYDGSINWIKGSNFYDQVRLKNKYYSVIHPQDTTMWTIMPNDTMIVLNQKCVAAKSTNMIVWFAPSLPIKAGKANYYGLPGLVLAVYDSRYKSVSTAQKIIPSVPEIKSINDLNILTLDEFREMQKSNAQKADKKGIRWFGL